MIGRLAILIVAWGVVLALLSLFTAFLHKRRRQEQQLRRVHLALDHARVAALRTADTTRMLGDADDIVRPMGVPKLPRTPRL